MPTQLTASKRTPQVQWQVRTSQQTQALRTSSLSPPSGLSPSPGHEWNFSEHSYIDLCKNLNLLSICHRGLAFDFIQKNNTIRMCHFADIQNGLSIPKYWDPH